MPRMQRRFVVGQEYKTTGPSKFVRRLKFVARFKIDSQEHLLFKPVRKARKLRQ